MPERPGYNPNEREVKKVAPPSRWGKFLRMAGMAGAVVAGEGAVNEQEAQAQPVVALPMGVEQGPTVEGGDKSFLPDMEGHLGREKGPDGQLHWKWQSLFFPAHVELGRGEEQSGNIRFEIPYEYSRLFNSGEPLRPEDHEKLAAYVDAQLRARLADVLRGLDISKRVYKSHHPEPDIHDLEVTSINITGVASPEGHRAQGPQTIMPDQFEAANRELALLRAKAGEALTREQLVAAGLDIDQAPTTVSGQEAQFSNEELDELAILAESYSGADDLEKTFNMIVAYNDGKIADQDVLASLDHIVAAKRRVDVEVTYKGGKKKTLLIPIPFLPLLPLFGLAFRRRGDTKTPPPTPGEKGPLPQIPEQVRNTKLPDPNSPEYKGIERRTVVEDLYVFIDDEQAIKNGLDYSAMADGLNNRYDEFSNDDERELYLATVILDKWKEHDLQARKSAGWQDNLDQGLDYTNQPEQIKWAKMHARALHDVVKRKRGLDEKDRAITSYKTLLERDVARLRGEK